MGIIIVIVVILLVVSFMGRPSKEERKKRDETLYSKTGSFADFDPGKDTDKVGDPAYPHAAMDNTLKEEYLDNLFDKK
ncbi:MAG: hypothetical protein K6F82_02270 [Sphaerochaetaceae bacterium]|nr:hypothetical protein [Sphaerochaetaceae bacterium]